LVSTCSRPSRVRLASPCQRSPILSDSSAKLADSLSGPAARSGSGATRILAAPPQRPVPQEKPTLDQVWSHRAKTRAVHRAGAGVDRATPPAICLAPRGSLHQEHAWLLGIACADDLARPDSQCPPGPISRAPAETSAEGWPIILPHAARVTSPDPAP